jgi:hypothetical protein
MTNTIKPVNIPRFFKAVSITSSLMPAASPIYRKMHYNNYDTSGVA